MLERLAEIHPSLPVAASIAALLVVALLADLITKQILLRLVRGLTKRTVQTWDDALVEHNVFGRLAQIIPALVIYLGIPVIPTLTDSIDKLIQNVALAYMILMLMLAIAAALSAVNAIYAKYPHSRNRPIKGFIQLIQIAIYIVGGIIIVSALIEKSPIVLLGGFGAMTAILLLVFKDTILSLVASVQLTGQDMVRVGDWIEMPQFGADGDVIDVALHTVKVQNWDKTITTIPTHRLISDSFKNWRGMSSSGGRRIKRSINLDVSSIRFLSKAEVARFDRFALLRDYLKNKQADLDAYQAALNSDIEDEVNLRRLTNIGTFRAYVYNYLKNHPKIHDSMTLIVRHLAPAPDGLPIEIYAFTNTTEWAAYEGIQADVFDHIMAIVPEFGLRLFQNPSGADFANLSGNSAPAES